jgi:two-component system phosphate regulon sensor histidine kinase PhoR
LQYKINIQFTIITLISIILCTCITAYVFYGALNREVFLDLKLYAEMLASEDLLSDSKLNIPDGIRVTLIDNDGNAIYDSMTDVTALENHNKRPEVIDAFRSGEGQARRRSSTLSNDAYYYAIKLDNGNVLRVAKEGSSLTSLITSIVPMLAVLLILLSIIFIGFSRVMTNNIVRPISQLAVDTANVNEDEIYPELRPFVKKIQSSLVAVGIITISIFMFTV